MNKLVNGYIGNWTIDPSKKMRDARTIILAVVSRRDLYYVSENNSFCF